jgi:hypothetical protein
VALLLNANRPTNFEVEIFHRKARHQMAGIPFAYHISNRYCCDGRQLFIAGHFGLLLTCHYRMKSEYSKMREAMLDLANLAYERELRRELSRVQRHIDQYRERESKFFNLHDIRLKFYREASDEIWHLYDRLEPDKAVERAVALGLLAADEVPDDIQHTLRRAVRCVS